MRSSSIQILHQNRPKKPSATSRKLRGKYSLHHRHRVFHHLNLYRLFNGPIVKGKLTSQYQKLGIYRLPQRQRVLCPQNLLVVFSGRNVKMKLLSQHQSRGIHCRLHLCLQCLDYLKTQEALDGRKRKLPVAHQRLNKCIYRRRLSHPQ